MEMAKFKKAIAVAIVMFVVFALGGNAIAAPKYHGRHKQHIKIEQRHRKQRHNNHRLHEPKHNGQKQFDVRKPKHPKHGEKKQFNAQKPQHPKHSEQKQFDAQKSQKPEHGEEWQFKGHKRQGQGDNVPRTNTLQNSRPEAEETAGTEAKQQ